MTFDPRPYEKMLHVYIRRLRSALNGGLAEEDLMQVGRMALYHAHQRFDPERGVKFETYAGHWVRQRLYQAVAEQSFPVRYPSTSYRRLRSANGRVEHGVSLDAERGGENGRSYTMGEQLVNADGMLQDEEAMLAAMEELTRDLVTSVCNDREADIFIQCGQGEALASAARRHGISRERARQLYERSLERVRKSPRLHELAEFLEAS